MLSSGDRHIRINQRQPSRDIIKGKELPIGTIRMHGGMKVKKVGPKKWLPVKGTSKAVNEKVDQATKIIEGKGSKSSKARDLSDLGLKTSAIAEVLDMHYSHAHSVVSKHKGGGGVKQKPSEKRYIDPIDGREYKKEDVEQTIRWYLAAPKSDKRKPSYKRFLLRLGVPKSHLVRKSAWTQIYKPKAEQALKNINAPADYKKLILKFERLANTVIGMSQRGASSEALWHSDAMINLEDAMEQVGATDHVENDLRWAQRDPDDWIKRMGKYHDVSNRKELDAFVKTTKTRNDLWKKYCEEIGVNHEYNLGDLLA